MKALFPSTLDFIGYASAPKAWDFSLGVIRATHQNYFDDVMQTMVDTGRTDADVVVGAPFWQLQLS